MKILLPIDGSRNSLNAARYVAERLWPRVPEAEIEVLHVRFRVPPRAASALGREFVANYYHSETASALKAVRKLLDGKGIPYQSRMLIGYPGRVIALHAESIKADLIVIGSHGMGASKSLVLGSTTQAVISNCSTALLVICDAQLPAATGEVLVAADGSAHTRRAVAFLLRHRQAFASQNRITLMHVSLPFPRFTTAARKTLEAQRQADSAKAVRGAQRLMERVKAKHRTLHVSGDPAERIVNHARGSHSSLIVMGSHGRGGIASLLLGSVAQKVVAAARTPILIVR